MKCCNNACRNQATQNFGAGVINLDACEWCWRIIHEWLMGSHASIDQATLEWEKHQSPPPDIPHIPA